MQLRSTVAAVILAAGATLSLAGIANAEPDRDCKDFATQAQAQAALESHPGDPWHLDADHDGIACESRFGEPTRGPVPSKPTSTTGSSNNARQIRAVPRGGVATGDGSTASDPVDAPALITLAGLGIVGVAAGAATRRSRRCSS